MAASTTYDEMFEEALDVVKNRFLLSVLLAKRVAQLRQGAEPLVAAQPRDTQPRETHEQIVFREIIEEKLEWRKTASAADFSDMDHGFADEGFDDGE